MYTPVSAAVPDTSKGAATIIFASVMPAVASALTYICDVHQLMFEVVTSRPSPSSSTSMYTQEMEFVPMTESST